MNHELFYFVAKSVAIRKLLDTNDYIDRQVKKIRFGQKWQISGVGKSFYLNRIKATMELIKSESILREAAFIFVWRQNRVKYRWV